VQGCTLIKDDRGSNGGTKFILRVKEQETRLTLHEPDENDDEKCVVKGSMINLLAPEFYI
jgi:hypothetical protein